MNSFPINSGALNGGGSLASIVYLPAATATVELALSERIVVSMTGGIAMSMDLTGDIYRGLNLGTASTGFGFVVTGDLGLNQLVYFDSSSIGFDLDPSGSLAALMLGPYGESSWGLDLSGDMDRRVLLNGLSSSSLTPSASITAVRELGTNTTYMALSATGLLQSTSSLNGSITKQFALSGDLTVGRVNYLPGSVTSWALDSSGWLSSNTRMQGDAQLTLTVNGDPVAMKPLSGAATYQMTVSAFLANNAQGYDLGAYLMTRPATNREMTR